MFDSNSDGLSERERDRIFNSETHRALRRAARLFGVAAVGVLTAVVILSLAAATAILSPPWQLHVAVTVIVALAFPVAVPYAMLRVYGLVNRDVVYVAKQAYREVIAEIVALSGTSTASVAFDESGTVEATDGASTALTRTGPMMQSPAPRAVNPPMRAVLRANRPIHTNTQNHSHNHDQRYRRQQQRPIRAGIVRSGDSRHRCHGCWTGAGPRRTHSDSHGDTTSASGDHHSWFVASRSVPLVGSLSREYPGIGNRQRR